MSPVAAKPDITPTGLTSQETELRPRRMDATAVDPTPQNGSKIVSPGAERRSTSTPGRPGAKLPGYQWIADISREPELDKIPINKIKLPMNLGVGHINFNWSGAAANGSSSGSARVCEITDIRQYRATELSCSAPNCPIGLDTG